MTTAWKSTARRLLASRGSNRHKLLRGSACGGYLRPTATPGPWVAHFAAAQRTISEATASELADRLDAEDWLRLDGQLGLGLSDFYQRNALLAPRMVLNSIHPWDTQTVQQHADKFRTLVDAAPRITDHDLQPAGDPGLASWRHEDPAKHIAAAVLRALPKRRNRPRRFVN